MSYLCNSKCNNNWFETSHHTHTYSNMLKLEKEVERETPNKQRQ